MSHWDEKRFEVVPDKRRKKPGPKRKGGPPKHVAGRGRGPGVKASEKKAALAGMLAAGVEKGDALAMAGYSRQSTGVLKSAVVVETMQQMRERLQKTPGFTLADSVTFYKEMSEDRNEKADTRLRARDRMDKVLGNDATKKVEISETQELAVAIRLLSELPAGFVGSREMAAIEAERDIMSQEAVEEELEDARSEAPALVSG